MSRTLTNVLFVSRENAFRSLLAEACLKHLGNGDFRVFSCGVPQLTASSPNRWTTLALHTVSMQASHIRCKSWVEFTKSGAPKMDFVIALDAKTMHHHPIWPGQPETALWDYPALQALEAGDPQLGLIAVKTLMSLRQRIELLVSLRSRGCSRSDLRHDLRDMAHI